MDFLKKFNNHLTAPENIQGTLDIDVEEDFETTEVRCEIACVEQAKVIREVYDPALKRSIPQVVDRTVVIYNVKPALSGSSHFAKGDKRSLPISINVPAGARPTYTGMLLESGP